jgi:hypothetical protein
METLPQARPGRTGRRREVGEDTRVDQQAGHRKTSMARTTADHPSGFTRRLKEIDLFFQRRDPVHQTMRRTVKRFEKAGIVYALVGGMALNAHRYRRTTEDVDFLLTEAGLEAFRQRFVGKDYDVVPDRPRRFVDRSNQCKIDILVTGRFPGSGKPGPIAFPDPAQVSEVIDKYAVVNLPTLIELKLAAHRWRDFADVVELIRIGQLDETFLAKLHPAVHQDFIECLEEKRREEEYEAREKDEPEP